MEFLEPFIFTYLSTFGDYLLAASIFFLVYYVVFRSRWGYKRIQEKWPTKQDYLREFSYSLLTLVVFAIIGVISMNSPLAEYNKVYWSFSDMPTWYYVLTIPIMFIMHDTYFYWMHRTLHHPKIFKAAHLVHHKSTNPSPWAAYSFHPIEAFFEALILPIIIFTIPVHISVVAWFFLFQIFYNVYGHLGYELYPKGFNKHWLGKWINTSIHHNLHHKHFDNSYGLYFTFWDRVMGTMAPQYDETFDEVKSRIKPSELVSEKIVI